MTEEVKVVIPWIPVISTLLGASIAFTASFFSAKFNKDREEKLGRDNRDRERIEKIFKLLVKINSEVTTKMGEGINHIHSGTALKQKDFEEFPPLLELEMLVNLYFPSLEEERLRLIELVHEFTKSYIEFFLKDYSTESLKKRQEDSTILAVYIGKIDKQVKYLQGRLISHVKA